MEHRLCSVRPRPTTDDDDEYGDDNDDDDDDDDEETMMFFKRLFKKSRDGLDKWNINFNPFLN